MRLCDFVNQFGAYKTGMAQVETSYLRFYDALEGWPGSNPQTYQLSDEEKKDVFLSTLNGLRQRNREINDKAWDDITYSFVEEIKDGSEKIPFIRSGEPRLMAKLPGLDYLPLLMRHKYSNDFDGDKGDITDEIVAFVIKPQGEMHYVGYSYSDFGDFRKLHILDGVEFKSV